jgi:hypothetical protein
MAIKKFSLQARTIIESASLDLDARQLEALATAAPSLEEVIGFYEMTKPLEEGEELGDVQGRPIAVVALDPVADLLRSIESLVDQTGTIAPKRRSPKRRKNPTAGA